MRQECFERWASRSFLEQGCPIPNPDLSGDWEPYETYMQAKVVSRNEDAAVLIVKFPPEAAEDNLLHVHPISDRRITVISGSGEFICYRERQIQVHPLIPGDRVWMPRGILHTFRAGNKGLLVESVHSPFIPFEHPRCLVYPKRQFNYE